MKQYFNAFVMCQSMFCAIPCPLKIWDENARDKQLLFFTFIGLEIGLLWFVLAKICVWVGIPHFITAFVLAVYPFVLSGYIHLDGFMDVTDAVKSCRNLERRREILKDSHVGAFAVIGCIMLIAGQFAAFCSADLNNPLVLVFIPIVSRCCSALALNTLKKINQSQYIEVKVNKAYILILALVLSATLICSFVFCGRYAAAAVAAVAGYVFALAKAYRNLDGINGDVAGYALTISEFCGILAFCLI